MTNKQYIEERIKEQRGFLQDILSKFDGKELEDEILFLFSNTLTTTLTERDREIVEEIEKYENTRSNGDALDCIADIKELLTPRE